MQKHACDWLVKEEDSVCLIPVPCGIQDGILKKKASHSNETDGNPTIKLFFFFLLLYSSYIKRKINWITLQ